jgi:sarcosine oxidase subunit alpha
MRPGRERLSDEASQVIHRDKTISFTYDGRKVTGFEGDTVASAMAAYGRKIFSRSFKYHRPRGLLCCSGDCPNCIVQIGVKPNVRACQTTIKQGMVVHSQHAWPSVEHDFLRIIELFSRLLPVGFYYKTLYKPRVLWKIAEPIIRRLAGLGKASQVAESDENYEHRHEYVDVLVVGGGPAGIRAAQSAAQSGASVLLVEREGRLGGHLRFQTRAYEYDSELPGYKLARQLEAELLQDKRVTVITEAIAFGCYEDNLTAILHRDSVIHVRSKAVVFATGCHQYPSVFRNNDLPGIMLSSAALRLINMYRTLPGRVAVILTSSDEGYHTAGECIRAGIRVAAIVDTRAEIPGSDGVQRIMNAGVCVIKDETILEAHGSRRVSAVTVGNPLNTERHRKLHCDLVLLSTGWQPNSALLAQAGCKLEFSESAGCAVPVRMAPGTIVAGEVAGVRHLPAILESGHIAGSGSVDLLNGQESNWWKSLRESVVRSGEPSSGCGNSPLDQLGKTFVCFCEDVTRADLKQGVEEGFDEIEILKRYSTVSMGPCQGRMCSRNSSAICGIETGRDLGAVGTTTARPPGYPVPLGALGGAPFHPTKYTSIHHKHTELTDRFTDMGVWKRPFIYSSVEAEYEAVRHKAGLIDLSTLGKLLVQGKDAPALLDRIYTHWFSNLAIGKARYAVMCDESGIVVDDGTIARLANNKYYITTSTSNVDLVEQWLKLWTAEAPTCAHIVNLTSGFAAVNLAGPESRGILSQLTSIDLSPAKFSYMSCREGDVAGVPAILSRVGFVGETSWEIHFPAEYGEYMWERLLEVGKDVGLRPFGVETQRVLRLEKKHIIVGQDTDALSNPFDADMSWVVKLDKTDFVGRKSLEKKKLRKSSNRLIGFEAQSTPRLFEGNAVIANGNLAGSVTSVRFSPHLKKQIGLAWVSSDSAAPNSMIVIDSNGHRAFAKVVQDCFYDPEGLRQK